MLNEMHSATIVMDEFIKSQSLVTRQAARDLFWKISEMTESNITLDFSRIQYSSRAFFDELNHLQNELELSGRHIELQNLNQNLASLFQIVRSRS